MSYAQLAEEQRYQIYALMKAGHRPTKIAAVVGVHKSTISREVRRNRGLRGYRPLQAHQLAVHRRQAKAQCRLTPEHWSLIERLLQEDWSPEQISLWLADEQAITIARLAHQSEAIEQLDNQIFKKDWWMTGAEAIALGIATGSI